MNQSIKVLLAAPSYDGRYDVRFMDSLINTMTLCTQHNIEILPYFLCYDSLVQRVRNDYFRVAYQSGVDVLFFIDSDIGWNPDDFVKLVLSDKDLIGGTYRKKTDDEELYAFKALGEHTDDFVLTPNTQGILEVAGLGCGFLKLSSKCVKILHENESTYYVAENEVGQSQITKNICECVVDKERHFVSEDIVICSKWQQLGGKVYLDTNISLIHVGVKSYSGSVKNWLKNWKLKISTQKNMEDLNKTLDSLNKSSKSTKSGDIDYDSIIKQRDEDDIFRVL